MVFINSVKINLNIKIKIYRLNTKITIHIFIKKNHFQFVILFCSNVIKIIKVNGLIYIILTLNY